MRDVDALRRQAASYGDAVGRFAAGLLDGPLPWTRMRRVYALLGLARRYGAARVNAACAIALAADMLDVHRLKRMLALGPAPVAAPRGERLAVVRRIGSRSLARLSCRCPGAGNGLDEDVWT
jgi:hypothetical protein